MQLCFVCVCGNRPDEQVYSPSNALLHEKHDIESGQYAFTTKDAGEYHACFERARQHKAGSDEEGEHHDENDHQQDASSIKVRLEWQTGVSTTDWESIASADNVKAMSRALESLESEVRRVHSSMQEIRRNEERMRDINEGTNSMVTWFALVSLGVCFSLTAWQVIHLKSFFGT